jgi:hypothetical protein
MGLNAEDAIICKHEAAHGAVALLLGGTVVKMTRSKGGYGSTDARGIAAEDRPVVIWASLLWAPTEHCAEDAKLLKKWGAMPGGQKMMTDARRRAQDIINTPGFRGLARMLETALVAKPTLDEAGIAAVWHEFKAKQLPARKTVNGGTITVSVAPPIAPYVEEHLADAIIWEVKWFPVALYTEPGMAERFMPDFKHSIDRAFKSWVTAFNIPAELEAVARKQVDGILFDNATMKALARKTERAKLLAPKPVPPVTLAAQKAEMVETFGAVALEVLVRDDPTITDADRLRELGRAMTRPAPQPETPDGGDR